MPLAGYSEEAKGLLLKANWKDPNSMHPDMLNRDEFVDLMSEITKDKAREQKVDALTNLASTNIIEEAAGVQSRFGIVESRREQYENPNLAAVLVWANDPGTGLGFYTAQARFKGSASGSGFDGTDIKIRALFDNVPEKWQETWDVPASSNP